MLDELRTENKVVGVKQLRKALEEARVRCVYLAKDADPDITAPLETLCGKVGAQCQWVPSMEELGHACGIAVGASAAGLLCDPE